MARITVEEALEKVSTRYELIILAAKRARQLATGGRRPTLEWEDDKPTVMALREIEAGTVYINRCDYLDPALAWTGVKETGMGCSLSSFAFDSFTRLKSYYVKYTD